MKIMRQSFVFPAKFHPEQGGQFSIQFVDLPEAITSGDSRQDGIAQAVDCLEEAITARIADGREIPAPSTPRRGQVMISLPADTAAKAALYQAILDTGISSQKLARQLGMEEKQIQRMLDPRHQTAMPRISKALAALGRKLVISVDAA